MDLRQRAATSVVLAVIAAVTLLPSALDGGDGTANGLASDDPGSEPPASSTVPDDGDGSDDDDNGGDGTGGDDTDSDGNGNGNGGTANGTTTSTSAPPPTSSGEADSPTDPPAPPPPASSVSIGVRSVGDLVPGSGGGIAATVSNSTSVDRTAIVSVQVTGATVADTNDGSCARSNLTVTCTIVVPAGSTVDLPVTVTVDDSASSVGVTVAASVTGPDPAPVAVLLPVSTDGVVVQLALTGQLDAVVIGNNLASCTAGASIGADTCADARDGSGAAVTNDDWAMAAIVGDGRGTGSSSGATLARVDDDVVVSALLVWGASTTGSVPAGAGSVRFATPDTLSGPVPAGNGEYVDVAADHTDATPGAWQSIADVTDLVGAAGDGSYWVGDISSDLGGTGAWAGWALVVVHESAGPTRDVVVLEGLRPLTASDTTAAIPVTATPSALTLSIVAWDGDRGRAGEGVAVSGGSGVVSVSNATNPVDDIANSTVSVAGESVTTRTPAHDNTLGVDIDRFDLAPTAGPIDVTLSSTDDDALLGLVVATVVH